MLTYFKSFWNNLKPSAIQLAQYSLGKYIIGFACLLHISWAVLLLADRRAGNATPLAVMFALLGNDRTLVILVLLVVAIVAGGFLDVRLRARFNLPLLALLLIPQQLVLWCSAGAGLYATVIQHYADGVPRSWPHILADQLPIILMALLYTAALLETRRAPEVVIQGRYANGEPPTS